MNKYIISLLLIIFALNAAAQTKPTIVSERVIDGKRMVIYSDGTWKEKEYTKPTIAFVSIPAGTFTMGSPYDQANRGDDEIPHQVTLSAFKMSKYEITNAQYAAFLNAKNIGSDGKYAAGAFPTQVLIYQSSGSYDWGLHYVDGQWVPVAGYENYPVISVTWYGASEFATYMGCRLPTEAEWEYACRAGTTTLFNTGNCLSAKKANYNGNFTMEGCKKGVNRGKPMPVGSFAPNTLGLYDMHGNVYEWCSDWYGTYSGDAQTNPKGPASGAYRVIRGGSWYGSARYCRGASRDYSNPRSYINYIGFRVVSH